MIAIDITKGKELIKEQIQMRKMKFTDRGVKHFLLINGIKQCWLAEQMLVSESMLSLLLDNKRTWHAKHIIGMSSILNIQEKRLMEMINA